MSVASLKADLRELGDRIEQDREAEVKRAIEFKQAGNRERAAYHTGLADGRNTVAKAVRDIATQLAVRDLDGEER